MPGFETLEQATPLGLAEAPIFPEDVRFADEGDWSDETALGIVLADIDSGIAYEAAKNWITQMELTDDLIRGYVRIRPWPNSDKARSALAMPIVLEAVEKILRRCHLALFGSGKDPFLITGVGSTKPDAASAWQELARWAVRVSDLKEQSRLGMKGIITYGWGGLTDGWNSKERMKRAEKYRRKEGGGVERNPNASKEIIAEPTCEAINLRNVIFDPTCPSQDPRRGKFYAVRDTVNAYDLDDMRKDPTYDEDFIDEETAEKKTRSKIPSNDQLREILALKQEPPASSMIATQPNQTREFQKQDDRYPMSKDPLLQPLERIEYHHSTGRVVTVLQRRIVIRNEQKKTDSYGMYGCAFIDVINSMLGFGVGRLVGNEQRFQQGALNRWVDGLDLSTNPAFQQIKGMGAGSQNFSIGPGKVITVEGELKPLVVTDVSATIQNALAASDQRVARRIGSEGSTNMPTQAMRTGSGVEAFQGADTEASQYFMECFSDMVFVPIIKSFLEHICEHLTPEQIQQILSDAGQPYAGNILDIYNADLKIEISAAAKLAVRQAAAQLAPLIINLVSNQAVQQGLQIAGKKFNVDVLLNELLELSGLDSWNLVTDMTTADQQRMQEMNQAMSQAAGRLALQQKQHADNLDEDDAKAASQAAIAVVKGHIKEHLDQATQVAG
jgi:hypothetical protein